MDNSSPYKLCLGTFFVLVLTGLKQRMSARQHYKGESDNLCDTDVFEGIVKIVKPSYQRISKGIRAMVSDIKSCKSNGGTYFPFRDKAAMEEFDRRVHQDYAAVLSSATEFSKTFLEIGTETKLDVRLVSALIDLALRDESIDRDADFFILESGEPIKKRQFGELNRFCLPAVILGFLCWSVKQDNRTGKTTYDQLCPQRALRAKRDYQGRLGYDIKDQITVYMPRENMDEVINAEVINEDDSNSNPQREDRQDKGLAGVQSITNSTINIVNCEKNIDLKNNTGTITINL